MTDNLSLKDFCQRLVESGLMTPDEILSFRQKFPSGQRPATGAAMAEAMLQRQRLTPFQAERLMEGKHQHLVLGNNILLEKIGEGGMGEVFRAEHRRMRRVVCVKVLRPSLMTSTSAIRRFQREAQAAAQLIHPNVVTAYDADEAKGIFFLVMEFVEGADLGSIVNQHGPLTVTEALSYIAQAARGLEYAHSKGVIHRDIKPGNLLLDRQGTVRVLDMGLARFDEHYEVENSGSNVSDQLTRENQIVGTVEYMAPEQADDSGQVDRRSDMYSLGCTLYRLLTGHPPYLADTPLKTLMAHRIRPIPSLRAERTDVPEAVDEIYKRMVAKAPADRYQTMGELLQALEPLVGTTGPSTSRSLRGGRRNFDFAVTRTLSIDVPSKREATSDMSAGDARTEQSDDQSVARISAAKSAPQAHLSRFPAVGIDLGTTFSVVAHLDDLGRPHALSNSEGEVITPSMVLFDGDEVVVGKEAVKAMSVAMEQVADCPKRELGQPEYHKQLDGQRLPPEVLQAYVLNKLRQDASRKIGPFRRVVITVPAYFDENRRKATEDAGYMAGFDVLDLINEPTAAALAYAFQRGQFGSAPSSVVERVLVYDLGGGTFDVTVMEIRGNDFITLATDGDVRLGGRDWDQRLLDYVAEQFTRKFGTDPREDPNILGRLWRDCEEAKRTLTARVKTHIICEFHGDSLRLEVSRSLLQELTLDLLERTAFTTRQAMEAAGLKWDQLNHVLLVGGATRMPAVVEMLRNLTGKEPNSSLAPDEVVAHGAALRAGQLLEKFGDRPPRFRIRNVNSHSLGIVGTDSRTGRKQNAILIARNTPLPASVKRIFRTSKPGQTSLHLHIVEGESQLPEECSEIGMCKIRGLPPNLPAQTPLEVRFLYAENGRITVTVQVPGQAIPIEQEIVRVKTLTQVELDRWRERICGLPPRSDSAEREPVITQTLATEDFLPGQVVVDAAGTPEKAKAAEPSPPPG
ncbi:MAG: Hsp70 family protein [Planctomycetota bacterium]